MKTGKDNLLWYRDFVTELYNHQADKLRKFNLTDADREEVEGLKDALMERLIGIQGCLDRHFNITSDSE